MLWMVIGYLFLFIFRPWEYWPALAPFRIERLYMIFLLALVFLWQGRRHIPHLITRWIMAFLFILLLSSIAAYRWTDASEALFDYFKLIVFYFVIIMTVKDERDLKKFILAYLMIMFLYVGKSAWEFVLHDRYIWRMGMRRLMGIDNSYGDPNALAASIVYSFPFLWAMIKSRLESPVLRKMLWAYGILAWASIVLTGSRSGMVTALLFLALIWSGASRKVVSIFVLAMVLFITWNSMSDRYKIRFESTFVKGIAPRGADESAEGRMAGLKQGIRTFIKHPVFGIGPGNFRYGWPGGIGGSAHNLYGELLGETGAAGAAVFLALVVIIVRTHMDIIKKTTASLTKGGNSPPAVTGKLLLLKRVSTASVQTIILLLFNGNFGHNLYRYNWLWIGAVGVLSAYFLREVKADTACSIKADSFRGGGLHVLPEQN